jgi:hypothetical protein
VEEGLAEPCELPVPMLQLRSFDGTHSVRAQRNHGEGAIERYEHDASIIAEVILEFLFPKVSGTSGQEPFDRFVIPVAMTHIDVDGLVIDLVVVMLDPTREEVPFLVET